MSDVTLSLDARLYAEVTLPFERADSVRRALDRQARTLRALVQSLGAAGMEVAADRVLTGVMFSEPRVAYPYSSQCARRRHVRCLGVRLESAFPHDPSGPCGCSCHEEAPISRYQMRRSA